MTEPRILGLVGGDPATALSGVARRLFDAIDKRFPVVDRVNYEPSGLHRLALAARTLRPSRSAWRAGFYTSLAAHRTLERALAARTDHFDGQFDLALQVHGWVTGQPRPYALLVDQTRLMADHGWPGWLALRDGERSELLALEHRMYHEADHVFVMSEAARGSVVDAYGVEPGRVTVVGGGPNFDRLPAPTVPAPVPTILFVGRDFERKGGDCLIRAFERVRGQIPDAMLHIVGVDRRFGVPGVVVHGKVRDRERLAALYRDAGVFCLPALYEPYGLVLLEAMAHGIPCVGTEVQAIPEILDHGHAGLLVAPGDPEALGRALVALLTDNHLASRLGAAGRRFVERELTWDRVAERMAPTIGGAAR
jgi:glycosyltransferase involved in cell wall biosynthesis